MMLSPTQKAIGKITEILEWTEDHKCDVNHQAFIEACNDAYILTWRALFPTGRFSASLIGTGVIALEVSCALLSTAGISVFVPLFIIQSNLPGAAQYRATTNQG